MHSNDAECIIILIVTKYLGQCIAVSAIEIAENIIGIYITIYRHQVFWPAVGNAKMIDRTAFRNVRRSIQIGVRGYLRSVSHGGGQCN